MQTIVEREQLEARIRSLEAACAVAKATLVALQGIKMEEQQRKWLEDAITILRAAIPLVGR